ncbi:GNAT family N-acetyltransferase [Nitriliruptor alkaliphilus]|uniref:GNAT family N-acetyltransferase n=1 Tax=Nitriliruptor alkaliphilus TaxID=427918 RepID=UPI000698A788|nr:GNAT family N-acetyltransferase [Nitriliruptor alkaliphilus]
MTGTTRSPHDLAGAVRELERVAARSFPPVEREHLAGWLLRASGGWTGRGNSALPVDVPADDVLAALPEVERWYRERGLPPMVALPEPPFEAAAGQLLRHGWAARHGALVLTASCASLLDELEPRSDLPAPRIADAPSEAWLAAYRYRGGDPPPQARGMLAAAGARFLGLEVDGGLAAIVRHVVEVPWVGITAMEVAPEHRRRGLARHLLRSVVADAVAAGSDRVWLQVDPTNVAGRALYEGVGFRLHHTYRYYQRGADARQEL